MVAVRKKHRCALADLIGRKTHNIQIGERAWCERAIIEWEWQTNYCCTRCMDKELREIR